MSWVKAASYNGDDVFDEDADDFVIQNKEWKANMERRVKDGFVEGIDIGRDAALQQGFNLGYKEGAATGRGVGNLKGIVCAIQCWYQVRHRNSPVPPAVTGLLQQVLQHEDALREEMLKSLETSAASVDSISDGMRDLGTKTGDHGDYGDHGGQQTEPGCGGGGCIKADCCSKPQQPHQNHSRKNCAFDAAENLAMLLQRCMDVVVELGLPQELIQHLQELRTWSEAAGSQMVQGAACTSTLTNKQTKQKSAS